MSELELEVARLRSILKEMGQYLDTSDETYIANSSIYHKIMKEEGSK